MGIIDKLKNVFFEEEYVEIEEPERPKKEVKKKVVEKPVSTKIEKEEIEEPPKTVVKEKAEPKEEVVEEEVVEQAPVRRERFTERDMLRREANFKLYQDDDFVDERQVEVIPSRMKKEVVQPQPDITQEIRITGYGNKNYSSDNRTYSGLYSKPEERKGFKATPIISPIYGILDKNYKKEDVVDKKERKGTSSYVPSKMDLDTVRQKAFGGELTSDLDLLGNDPIKPKEEIIEDFDENNLLYDMSDYDNTPAVEKVTLADAEEYFEDLGLEYNIDYKDSRYEKSVGRRVNHPRTLEIYKEEEEIRPKENKKSTTKEVEESIEDNLFDLIDSMYEE